MCVKTGVITRVLRDRLLALRAQICWDCWYLALTNTFYVVLARRVKLCCPGFADEGWTRDGKARVKTGTLTKITGTRVCLERKSVWGGAGYDNDGFSGVEK